MKNYRLLAVAGALALALTMLIPYSTDVLAAGSAIIGDGSSLSTFKHLMIATAAVPATLDQLGEQFATYHTETKAQATAFDGRMGKLEREVKAARESSDRIETMMSRLPRSAQDGLNPAPTQEQKAFNTYIRRGSTAMGEEETKALATAPDTSGGYITAPHEFMQELLRNIVEMSPVRQVARVTSISSGGLIQPKRTSKMTARWVTETEEREESSPAYGQVNIPAREASCYVDVSATLLEDSAFNLESELAVDFAEEFGRIEGEAFVNGDGVKSPAGFMQSSDIGFEVSGSVASIADATGQADGLINLFYGIPTAYSRNGTWGMNRRTMAAVRKLKNAENGYIWQPALVAGQPPTIMGRPVLEIADMPDIAAGTFPVVFGDFTSGYRIVDRIQLGVLRDPYTIATKGQVRFHARRRVGGAVVKGEALRKLKVGTA